MDSVISLILSIVIILTAIAMVLTIGMPITEAAFDNAKLNEAERIIRYIDTAIEKISSETPGSSRVIEIRSDLDKIRVDENENSFELGIETDSELQEYYSVIKKGNLYKISGNDVTCNNNANLTMKNSLIEVTFRKINGPINTNNLIINITQNSNTLTFTDTTIIIDNNVSSSSGTGYTEILKTGVSMPSCTIHAFVNSPANDYDVYYTLFAGMDYVLIEVENIR